MQMTRGSEVIAELGTNAAIIGAVCENLKQERVASSEVQGLTRDELIAAHVGLVRVVARSLASGLPRHVELGELESAGYIGLIEAATKFHAAKHVQFRSYAQFRIRGAMLDSLRSTDWGPRYLRKRARDIEGAIRAVRNRVQRDPSEAEIASELGIHLEEYQQTLMELRFLEVESLSEPLEGHGADDLAQIADPSADTPLSIFLEAEVRNGLNMAIDQLPERERLVVMLSYVEELTLKEIGMALNVTESRVCQLRSSAVLKLRASLAARKQRTVVGGQKMRHGGVQSAA